MGSWSDEGLQTQEFDPFGVLNYSLPLVGRQRRQGGGVGCKMAAGGRASPRAGEGEEMAGAVSRRAIPRGASGTVLGCGEQLGGVMGGETPATRESVKTGSRSAGAFQGNMAGGGGGFSPEAQRGAAAVEPHKGEPLRAEGFCRLVLGARRGWGWGRGNLCSSSLGGDWLRRWDRVSLPEAGAPRTGGVWGFSPSPFSVEVRKNDAPLPSRGLTWESWKFL